MVPLSQVNFNSTRSGQRYFSNWHLNPIYRCCFVESLSDAMSKLEFAKRALLSFPPSNCVSFLSPASSRATIRQDKAVAVPGSRLSTFHGVFVACRGQTLGGHRLVSDQSIEDSSIEVRSREDRNSWQGNELERNPRKRSQVAAVLRFTRPG